MTATKAPAKEQFDADYYQRFYEDADTRAVSADEQQRQAGFIAAYLGYLDIEVAHVLDMGCGMGQLLRALQHEWPAAICQGVEYSDYICHRFGWTQGSVVVYAGEPADLVVCNDVLAYLTKRDCQRAISNLARLTTQALYLSVLTSDDLEICDAQHTDMNQRLRPAAWYRQQLDKRFVAVGGGLFLKKPLSVGVWQLERS